MPAASLSDIYSHRFAAVGDASSGEGMRIVPVLPRSCCGPFRIAQDGVLNDGTRIACISPSVVIQFFDI